MRLLEMFQTLKSKLPSMKKKQELSTIDEASLASVPRPRDLSDNLEPITANTLIPSTLPVNRIPGLLDTVVEVSREQMHEIGKEETPQFINWPEQMINYVVRIKIPKGFCYKDSLEFPYGVHMTFDEHTLTLVEHEENHLGFTSIVDGKGNLAPLQSTVLLKKVLLDGHLYFNFVLTGFKPLLEAGDIEEKTAFSGPITQRIRHIIGYMGTGSLVDEVEPHYTLLATKGIEFVVLDSKKVENDPTKPKEQMRFQKSLDGKRTYYIYVPVVILLKPDIKAEEGATWQ